MRLEVVTATATRFVEVLAAQERLALARQTAELTAQTHKTVGDRVKSGIVPITDEQRALVRLSTERIAVARAERQLDTARQKLAALWAGDSPVFTSAAGALGEPGALPAIKDLAGHLADNPQVARWAVEIAQRRAAIDLAKSKAVPDVTGSLGVRRMHEEDDTVFLFEFMVPLPLTDRNEGGILESRYSAAKAQSERKAAEVAVRTELAEAYNDLAAAHHEATTLRDEAMPAARAAFESARSSYELGRSSLLEVFDAQRTLFDVQRQQIDAMAAYRAAAARVEGLIGRALP
jgi:cobalt-zinc-cadmium efflux system outer membrane protein